MLRAVFGVGLLLMLPGLVWAADPDISLSGFLEKYPPLEPDRDREGAWLYINPEWDKGAYDKVMIDDVVIFFHPKSDYKGINPRQMLALAEAFRKVLVEQLEPEFPVVDASGKGVMRMRIAIANVHADKAGRGWFGSSRAGAGADALGGEAGRSVPGVSLREASIEAELVDSTNDRRLGVLVDTLPQTDRGAGVAEASWQAIEDTFRFYAARFKQRIGAERREAAGQ